MHWAEKHLITTTKETKEVIFIFQRKVNEIRKKLFTKLLSNDVKYKNNFSLYYLLSTNEYVLF